MKGHLEELTSDELIKALNESKSKIQEARFKVVTGNMDNTKLIREEKKKIARILTLKKEYDLGKRKK
ncbi:MAG: 50S ribosomal protein L29 [Spirochaetes bacterium]|nr:50S ribosomal protein L29 [Spirochaetota bacterium]MBN2769130.1 50S ribosomal protein L29 [Spirochaetota bacterium]HRX15364.1 50S ribosomal protein L29 [Spirochaetota bacterium]